MNTANQLIVQWGPALLVCFTVLLGMFYQNYRMSDLRDSLNKRIDDLKSLMTSEINGVNQHISTEINRLDQRIERLESPFVSK